jgi:EmrB/QacA subfamily drug resistance transporter
VQQKWWTLTAVGVAIFMLLLDITIVNVALPDIQRELGASFSDLQWVVDAYALSLASLLLVSGSVADLVGRRRIFSLGLVIFSAASLACGLASSPTVLTLSRAVQGIGGAMMFATSLALVAQAFRGPDRGVAFGVIGAVTGAAVAVGPLVGGLLTDGLGWEWIFLVNVPIGIAAFALTQAKVDESSDPRAGGVDVPGVVTFSGALFCLIFALVRGNQEGWSSALIVGLLAGFVVLLSAFVLIELRRAEPMLDLALFRKPAFAGASITAFALSASLFSLFLYISLYLQNILDYSPLETGLRFLPVSVLSFFVGPLAGRLSARFPARLFLGSGLLLVSVGLLLMHGLTVDSGWTALLAGFCVAGIGVGLVNPPLASTAIGVVEPARSGMASGINSTFRQVGIATGIAALGAVFQHRVESIVVKGLAGTPASDRAGDIAQAVSSGGAGRLGGAVPPQARATVGRVTTEAFVGAFNTLLLIGAIVAFVGAICAAVLVRQRDFVSSEYPAAEAEAEPEAAAA